MIERRRENYRRWRARNLEYERERVNRYNRSHRECVAARARNRRAKKRRSAGDHTAVDIAAQHARQRGRCFYCGRKIGDTYHVDHVIPLAMGGSNGPENLVCACPACNLSKGPKHPMDFAGLLF